MCARNININENSLSLLFMELPGHKGDPDFGMLPLDGPESVEAVDAAD